jgi:hypothetical protein
LGSTFYFFALPSFLTGMARSLDLAATLEDWSFNFCSDAAQADAWAIANDWAVIGQDMRIAIDQLREEVMSE